MRQQQAPGITPLPPATHHTLTRPPQLDRASLAARLSPGACARCAHCSLRHIVLRAHVFEQIHVSSSLIRGCRFVTTHPTPPQASRRPDRQDTPASSHESGTRPGHQRRFTPQRTRRPEPLHQSDNLSISIQAHLRTDRNSQHRMRMTAIKFSQNWKIYITHNFI